jgi:serine protease Do
MRLNFGIAMACLAASLSAQVTVRAGGASYLGVGVADITAERAKALNLKEERGAEVTNLTTDSPAAKAGIKEGDVVLDYDGVAVEGIEQLTRLVRETPVGRQVKISVWRNGAAQTLTATIEARKGTVIRSDRFPMATPFLNLPQIELPRFQMALQNPVLGIEGESLRSQGQLAEFFGVKDGLLVKSVGKNSAAEKAGMKAGDVVVKVDDSTVATSQEITRALRALGSKRTFTVTVVRNKKEIPLTVTLEAQGGAIRPGDPARECE